MKTVPTATRPNPSSSRWAAAVALVCSAALAGCGLAAPPSSPSGEGSSTTTPAAESTTPPPPPATSWGPLEAEVDDAAAAVAEMTTAQKAGQILVQYYTGADPAAAQATAAELDLGGVIIMGDNVPQAADGTDDTEALASIVDGFRTTMEAERGWPAIVSVDQEGGRVARLQAPLTEWSTPMAFGAAGDPELTGRAQQALAGDLAELGFTMNFSPDADVTLGPQDPVIGARSYSSDPGAVAEHALAAVDGSLAAGVLPSLKHFPGHGSVTTDSHVGLPVQPATREELAGRDWIPFAAGAGSAEEPGAPMVMVGHIAVTELEAGVPSSLSAASYEALREDVGFDGVAVTDALNMGALHQTAGNPAVNALAAGADLLLMPSDVRAAHAAIVAAVDQGSIPAERLDEAATRVVAMMMWQQRLAEEAAAGQESEPSTDVALEAARAAVTQVSGTCGADLVGESIRIIGGNATDRARLTAAAQEAGLAVGSGPVVTLLGTDVPPASGDVVVTLDAPWPLAGSAANEALIALYGRNAESFTALVEVLTGEREAPGKLPVDVGEYASGSGC
ncbi:glycoside hydrolase family 3 N-terminal domain-containing protein [Zhihengliuella salsuginis]|uniref:beta-N-acetylhexosaminidase n=1 Tax=Zhihengliuella salsuginis TaxID=578222 RepID=A0ABQ3GF93_9MICC|nr:glycoside hydrolase family 3 N-terminal domain-containing protein [Zhihengliuella salsuginis]GHD04271.1 beta-N-acetylhexosaminidase [Zhihengliuella salsuginis]